MDDCAAPGQSQQPAGNKTGRTVTCVKFQKTLPGLDAPPWPGELGQRIFENVSAQAWKLWEDRQKMILNEYRLMPWQKEAQELIGRHMEDFFFGAGAALPPGYVPQQAKYRRVPVFGTSSVPASQSASFTSRSIAKSNMR